MRYAEVALVCLTLTACAKRPPKTTVDVDTMREASFLKDGPKDAPGAAKKPEPGAPPTAASPTATTPSATPPTSTAPANSDAASSDPIAEATRTTRSTSDSGTSTGFSFGARLGYAIPFGQLASGTDLSKSFSGGIPLVLDVGYRVIPNVVVGIYGQYGLLFAPSDACANASCSGHDIRLGVNVHYHVFPERKIDPWAGIGVGYEWATLSSDAASVTTSGFELVNLLVGVDFAAAPHVGVGPFASFSFGQFTSTSISGGGQSSSGDISNAALHEWLTVGVRGRYDL